MSFWKKIEHVNDSAKKDAKRVLDQKKAALNSADPEDATAARVAVEQAEKRYNDVHGHFPDRKK